jgi:hypothetical protein
MFLPGQNKQSGVFLKGMLLGLTALLQQPTVAKRKHPPVTKHDMI